VNPIPNGTGRKVVFSLDGGESESDADEPLELAGSRQNSPHPPSEVPPTSSPKKDGKDEKRNHYRHDTWERKNVLQEHTLMDRRREALTRGLETEEEDGTT
jgi:hypothetical protein